MASKRRVSPQRPLALSNRADGTANQERLKLRQSALLSSGEEYVEEVPLCCRIYGTVLTVDDMLPGAGHELADIGFFESQEVRDLTIGIVERYSKNVRSAFCRRELLQ